MGKLLQKQVLPEARTAMLIRRTDHLHTVRKLVVLREAVANKILVIPYQPHFYTMCAV